MRSRFLFDRAHRQSTYPAKLLSALVLLSLLLAGQPAATSHADSSTVYRVVPGGIASGACGDTWPNGCELQHALSFAAVLGDQVWVKAGVYKPDIADPGNPALSFNIVAGKAVYGGFAGTESSLSERNPAANLTILSGDIDSNDVNADGNGIDETPADIVGLFSNSYHVVYMNGTSTPITTTTVLDGFTITGGRGLNTGTASNGAGLYCDGSGASKGCSPTLTNLTFAGNSASYSLGGGIYTLAHDTGESSPQLTNVTFRGNTALDGGGMNNDDFGGTGQPNLTNVTFYDNSASIAGGALFNFGPSGESSPTLTNVTFNSNSAGSWGGAMYNKGPLGTVSPELSNVILWGDSAGTAGSAEIFNEDATPTIHDSVVAGDCTLISGTTCGSGNLTTDPKLDTALAINGGFTPTLATLAGSSAIDAGTNTGCTPFDQRGLGRPVNSVCDIGALEAPTFAAGPICYVDASGSGTAGSGASWSDPYIHLQMALANSACTQVWVADGLYKPGSHVADSFTIAAAVAVYGGFAGGEGSLGARNPAAHVAVLSGDIDSNDTNKDVNGVTPTAGDIVGDNVYHVVKMTGSPTNITSTTVLDGFTLSAGHGTDSGYDSTGGGLLCSGGGFGQECSPSLAHLVIIGNSSGSGGGMMLNGAAGTSSPTLTDVSFVTNEATSNGGAMFNEGFDGLSSPQLTNVTFSNNSAAFSGGAIYSDGSGSGISSPKLNNVTFDGNSASAGHGGAMYNDGHASGSESSPQLFNVTFHGNTAVATGGKGGAIYNYGLEGSSTPALTNVILWGDSADSDPEIFNDTATPGFSHSVVQGSGGSGAWVGPGTDLGGNVDADPKLDPAGLANNGGYTRTLRLLSGSSATNAADDGACSPTDQRGVSRPLGAHCDIGAFERGAGTFEDVPVPGKEWMEPWIDAFYAHGITSGCNKTPPEYCPENQVTRAEMAVFLLRAKHGGSYTPPAPTHDFADVPVTGKEWMEPWIEQFFAEGVTTGCGGGNYCPENNVTRAEMAVFVLRALHGGGYAPPAASGFFADVPVTGKEWMEPWIIQFRNEGITTGCGGGNYCPENNVTRAEMAVFIDRAYHFYP